jgi:hypothetical protein
MTNAIVVSLGILVEIPERDNSHKTKTDMKKPILTFIVCCTILLVSGCSSDHQTGGITPLPYKINLETDITHTSSIPLSSICSNLEYVPLETGPDCMLSGITHIYVSDSSLYVTDGSALLLFNRTGGFVSQIGSQGRGPGEYKNITDFTIDNSRQEICILEPRIVHVFDFNGKHKRDLNIDPPCYQFISLQGGSFMFHTFYYPPSIAEPVPSWHITDNEGVVQMDINSFNRDNLGFIVAPPAPLYMFNGSPHFMETGTDTLHYLDNHENKPYAIFNPGKMRMEPFKTDEDMSDTTDKIWVWDILEDKDLLYIRISWNFTDSITNCIYNKQEKRFTALKENGFVNDIDGGLPFWPAKIQNDKMLIGYADAFDMIKYYKGKTLENNKMDRFVSVINQLEETSNPVLILVNPGK